MVHNFEFILDFFLIHTVSKLNKFKMVGFLEAEFSFFFFFSFFLYFLILSSPQTVNKVVALVRKFWMSCVGLLYQFMCNYSHSPVGTPSCWWFFCCFF